jgi:NAD(P)-dependent dehydrogenase (short-subunit alcohol dehydrogenase family)
MGDDTTPVDPGDPTLDRSDPLRPASACIGHFHLVNQVFDLVKASPRARVVTVASEAHRFGQLDAGDLNYQYRAYNLVLLIPMKHTAE